MNSRYIITLILLCGSSLASTDDFKSTWHQQSDSIWLGPDYWANPMEDWQVADGRLECIRPGRNRNIHLLTRQLTEISNTGFVTSVTVGRADDGAAAGSVGFRVGISSDLGDYRSALLFGKGTDAGVTTGGTLFIDTQQKKFGAKLPQTLRLELRVAGNVSTLIAFNATTGSELARLAAKTPGGAGNVALVNNHPTPGGGERAANPSQARFWFADWKISGDRVEAHPERAFGPILFAHHSLNRTVLKLTAHLPPVGRGDAQEVTLEIRQPGEDWKAIGTDRIHPLARTVTFRHDGWDGSKDIPYRLRYRWRGQDHYYTGTIRKEPVGRPLVVAGFTGNTDPAFPNAHLIRNVTFQNPDLLVFTGDQIYEGVGGFGIHRQPVEVACLNYLRKWWLCGWAFRELTRDRPALFLPDDHDVYQGNIWGQGGRKVNGIKEHATGGYAMAKDFVNAVQRTQTSHHPDAWDPTPVDQGITVYYGGFTYGGVSFAVIEDRKFKSGPQGKVNDWPGRPDHVKDPSYNVVKLDKPGLKLLGDRQLEFLHAWAKDWRGVYLKVVLSQTIFCNLANYHGGNQQFIWADLDSNGWPQTGRRRAVEAMRRGHAFHLAGDQHLPSIVQHGVATWNDAGYSFCVPSIAAGYPRSWRADAEGRPVQNRPAAGLPNTGEYKDGFENLITVHAIGNPAAKNRRGRLERLHDKASGHGILRLDPSKQSLTIECWRLLFDAANPKPGDQFPGWPKTIEMTDNYGRAAKAWLPTLHVQGPTDPVIHVEQANGQHVYSLRIKGHRFRPKVFADGLYRVVVEDVATGKKVSLEINSQPEPGGEMKVQL